MSVNNNSKSGPCHIFGKNKDKIIAKAYTDILVWSFCDFW